MFTKTTMLPTMSRRMFLSMSGLGLSSLLAACRSIPVSTGNQTSTPVPTNPPATKPPVLTDADWTELASSLQGTLIRPDNSQYAVARQLFSTRFDSIEPAGVVYCANSSDIQKCLSFIEKFNLPVTARSGGHSYAGYSTSSGLVLDITRMNGVDVDMSVGTATIGGGAHLIDVYSTLSQSGVVIPAGSCPTVGITGLTLGGGVGVLGRKFGLTCDNLLSAQIVLANGKLITCDKQTNSDLFWALQGGGGGNFGVVTSLTFQVHPVSELSLFTLNWPWQHATAVVNTWQHWGPNAPDELWSNCLLLGAAGTHSQPTVRVNGVYVGEAAPLNAQLQQLINQIGLQPSSSYVYTDPLLETMMVEAGCYGETVATCHLPSQNPQGKVGRDTSQAKSDYVNTALPIQAIDILVNAINARQASSLLANGGIGMDSYGGAINRVAADATAFVHRNSLFSIQYTASWNAGDPNTTVQANAAWLNSVWTSLRPYVSGEAYQNYIDPQLPNWEQAYYGSNLTRLKQVKATYDPGNLFHFAQSITPA